MQCHVTDSLSISWIYYCYEKYWHKISIVKACCMEEYSCRAEYNFYIVNSSVPSVLGAYTCRDIGLIQRLYSIHSEAKRLATRYRGKLQGLF